VLKW